MEEKKPTAIVRASDDRSLVSADVHIGYFGSVALGYRFVRRVLVIVLALFLVLFSCFFYRAFSYDSLFYFAKDVVGLSALRSDQDEISYAYHEGDSVFAFYHGAPVRVSSAGVEIFRADGVRELFDQRGFTKPRVCASRKNVIAYDHAGKDFYVYNTFSKLYHGTTEHPILGIYPSDSGGFAVLTTSESALSAVLIYNREYKLMQSFQREAATLSVAIDPSGDRIALFGIQATEGETQAVLDLFRIGEQTPYATRVFQNELPLAVHFLGGKEAVVITSGTISFLNGEGEQRRSMSFDGGTLRAVDVVADEGVAIALLRGEMPFSTEVISFDKRGNERFRHACADDISELALDAQVVYAYASGRIYRIHRDGAVFEPTNAQVCRLFAIDRNCVALVCAARTQYYSFQNK